MKADGDYLANKSASSKPTFKDNDMNELLIEFVENDPLYVKGYTDIRLAGSEISIGGIVKHWKGGLFPPRYYYSLRINFKYRASQFIGADCDTLETAKDKAIRQLAAIFRLRYNEVKVVKGSKEHE